jgi:hypothetical protein
VTRRKMLGEFRRFTNAVRKYGNGRDTWGFVAEAEDDLVLVIVNREHNAKRAAVLEALVQEWGGNVLERSR